MRLFEISAAKPAVYFGLIWIPRLSFLRSSPRQLTARCYASHCQEKKKKKTSGAKPQIYPFQQKHTGHLFPYPMTFSMVYGTIIIPLVGRSSPALGREGLLLWRCCGNMYTKHTGYKLSKMTRSNIGFCGLSIEQLSAFVWGRKKKFHHPRWLSIWARDDPSEWRPWLRPTEFGRKNWPKQEVPRCPASSLFETELVFWYRLPEQCTIFSRL